MFQSLSRALILVATGSSVFGVASGGANLKVRSSDWLSNEETIAQTKLFDNISRPGTLQGIVVASPQTANPDYYYYWIRDGALTMKVVLNLYINSSDPTTKAQLKQRMSDYVDLSQKNQSTQTIAGLGEPKFNPDGSDFTGSWARPQNDGAALRAITLTNYAQQLLSDGNSADAAYVRSRLYGGEFPATTIIKQDLEYIAHNWMNPSFDPWEEIEGTNFYTRRVQRKAMIVGAALATIMGDSGAASYYSTQATQIEQSLNQHMDYTTGLIIPTVNRTAGVSYKTSNMDASTILGIIHGATPTDPLPVTHELVLSTIYQLTEKFRALYPINQTQDPGVAIGRYPEDLYAGSNFNGGNPWVLLTMGFAEALYDASAQFAQAGTLTITPLTVNFFNGILQRAAVSATVTAGETIAASNPTTAALFNNIVGALVNEADSYVARVQTHANPDGSLSEQMDRNTGFMTSAADLTWNYASVLTAGQARQSLQQSMNVRTK